MIVVSGHNIPDGSGNRYCINLVSIAGQAPAPSHLTHVAALGDAGVPAIREEIRIRLPPCCMHPLVLVPAAALCLLVAGVALVLAASDDNSAGADTPAAVAGWVLGGAGMVCCVAVGGFLATLLALGVPCCRDEGPRAGGTATPYSLDLIYLALTPQSPSSNGDSSSSSVGGGSIAMGVSPGRKRKGDQRDLDADLARIRHHWGVDVVVTLLQQREMDAMGLAAFGERTAAHGMQWLHFPVRDKWIPTDSGPFLNDVVVPVAHLLSQGKRLLVHCNGGKGRTGTLVAAVLFATTGEGMGASSLREATSLMRAVRPGMLRNPLQRLYLRFLRHAIPQLHGHAPSAEPPRQRVPQVSAKRAGSTGAVSTAVV